MAFHESAIFPTDISYGSTGGAGYSTTITKLDSGHEIRNSRWSQARHRYDASYGIKTLEQLNAIVEFYHARQGAMHGFRWHDPMDFSTDSTRRANSPDWDSRQTTGVSDYPTGKFQLQTWYTHGGATYKRNITKPVSGTLKVGWVNVEKTEGTHWSCDYSTGVVTIDAGHLTTENIQASFNFHVPCRFGEEIDAHLPLSFDAFEMGSIGKIPIVEIKSELEGGYDYDAGGAKTYVTTGAGNQVYSHGMADGRVIMCVATNSEAIRIELPLMHSSYAYGSPYFMIFNEGDGGAVTVYTNGVLVGTLQQNQGGMIGIVSTTGQGKHWFMG
tara:strand:+ start:707 stop:1690 length:984 start_codon:yes stop_codon:yes gene_type:complete